MRTRAAIAAADANRRFSELIRHVREEGSTYVVTSHGRPVARIIPVESDQSEEAHAHAALMHRLRLAPVMEAGTWSRDDLYDRTS